ncbi:AAA family ATPase [Frigidibacter mobilis]|uniref:Lon protease, putative n=1 Tax=Frigidibacter mobilis TaxID=1335048 RepID=A0A159Z0C8_9RHOB|nr:AAA family ATPase [Frigidibacter mobilis]AMY68311.1 Lon protease, putative [Frigidibacter mobilis]
MTNSSSSDTKPARPLLTRIPFIEARFPDPNYTSSKLVDRFNSFWSAIREAKVGPKPEARELPEDGLINMEEIDEWMDQVSMPYSVTQRIKRRAARLAEAHKQRSPMTHLQDGDLRRLELVRGGVDLVRIRSEHEADEIASKVHEEFPWMAPATDVLWNAMRLSVRNGEPGFRLSPLLLDGPPGIGKSTWARHLAKLIGTEEVAIDASGEGAGFGIIGLQRGWGSALPGRPLALILQEMIGNPLVIIDEVEKAGSTSNSKGQTFSLTTSLLPLLEKTTARGWNCPYFRVPFDMSWISWVLTSNNAFLLPPPFRSRCTEIEVRNLTVKELQTFVLREQLRRGLSDDVTAGIIGALERSAKFRIRPSLRTAMWRDIAVEC